jgi:DNA replication regulator SLD3
MEVKFYEFNPNLASTNSNATRKDLASNQIPTASIIVEKVIDRVNLPLSWLDLHNRTNASISTPRLFSSNSVTLGNHFQESEYASPVLLAKDTISSRHVAIERLREGVYAFCWIGSWVPNEQLGIAVEKTPVIRTSAKRKLPDPIDDNEEWWTKAALPESISAPIGNTAKKPRFDLSRPPSLPKSVPSLPVSDIGINSNEVLVSGHLQEAAIDAPVQDPTPLTLDKDQLFENFVCQYLESLYLSRTSLAFLAKGPLSRLRTTFSSSSNPQLSIRDLTIFFRNMILTFSAMDKKFKGKLPELARDLALDFTDEETTNDKKGRKKAAKKKKLKLDKYGVYPFETEYIKKWWKNDQDSHPNPDETGEQRIRRRVNDLRIRETLAQIVLLLEILALESSAEWRDAEKVSEDVLKGQEQQADRTETKQTKKRIKKPQELTLLLGMLVDKLTIWQSVEQDSQLLAAGVDSAMDSVNTWNKDRLGAFCVEVIVPLYVYLAIITELMLTSFAVTNLVSPNRPLRS